MNQLDKLFTVEDIALMTSLTTRTMRNYLKDGSLKGKKIGGQWRFTMEDVQNFMGNGNVVEKLSSETKQSVLDFIDGVNTDVSGEIQICTIADVYCSRDETIKSRDTLMDVINNSASTYPFLRFAWEFNEQEEKARFTLFGNPEFIIKAIEIIR